LEREGKGEAFGEHLTSLGVCGEVKKIAKGGFKIFS
jgi:hypothetical protein